MTDESEQDWTCVVKLRIDDVPESIARRFFADGNEVEGVLPLDGYTATIEYPGPIERA